MENQRHQRQKLDARTRADINPEAESGQEWSEGPHRARAWPEAVRKSGVVAMTRWQSMAEAGDQWVPTQTKGKWRGTSICTLPVLPFSRLGFSHHPYKLSVQTWANRDAGMQGSRASGQPAPWCLSWRNLFLISWRCCLALQDLSLTSWSAKMQRSLFLFFHFPISGWGLACLTFSFNTITWRFLISVLLVLLLHCTSFIVVSEVSPLVHPIGEFLP